MNNKEPRITKIPKFGFIEDPDDKVIEDSDDDELVINSFY